MVLFRAFGVFVFLFWFIFSPTKIIAQDVYFDDFNGGFDSSSWAQINPEGFSGLTDNRSVTVISETIEGLPQRVLRISGGYGSLFPSVYPIIQIPDDNYSVEIKFTSTTSQYGFSFSLSEEIPFVYDYNDYGNGKKIFTSWPYPGDKYVIASTICSSDPSCVDGEAIDIVDDGVWTKLRIDYSKGIYKLYVNDLLKFTSRETLKKAKYLWFGNSKVVSNPLNWGDLLIDYLRVSITVEAPKSSIIFVPGFGASWDLSAVLSGKSGNGWAIPSQITVYDNLIKSIENNGYEKDKNLYIFAYDWRKPLNVVADDFKSFLDSKTTSGEKVKVVGHSMGGLVARSYIQEYGSEKIDKLVIAGSPNKGTLQAYGLWQGTTAWTNDWWSQAMVELLIESNRLLGETRTDTLRRISPSVKDLMPTYNFLISNGSEKDWQTLTSKNSYLNQLNQQQNNIDSLLGVLIGKGVQTNEKVKVEPRTWLDRLWKRWEDGRPITDNPFTTTDGDGSVTINSAGGIFANKFEVIANHGETVGNTAALEKIMDELGLDKTKISLSTPMESSDGVFMAFLKSPGKLQVCKNDICNENLGINLPSNKLFILPKYSGEKISVKVLEDGQGEYSLHLGKADKTDSKWELIQGSLNKSGQIDSYIFDQGKISIGSKETTEDNLRESYKNLGKLRFELSRSDLVEKLIKSKENKKSLDIAEDIRAKVLWQMQLSLWHKQSNYLSNLANLLLSLDRYMDYRLSGVVGKYYEHKKVFVMTDEYRRHIERQIKNTKSLNSGEYYEKAVSLIEEAKLLENRKLLAEDKLQSARSWLTAAWLFR